MCVVSVRVTDTTVVYIIIYIEYIWIYKYILRSCAHTLDGSLWIRVCVYRYIYIIYIKVPCFLLSSHKCILLLKQCQEQCQKMMMLRPWNLANLTISPLESYFFFPLSVYDHSMTTMRECASEWIMADHTYVLDTCTKDVWRRTMRLSKRRWISKLIDRCAQPSRKRVT